MKPTTRILFGLFSSLLLSAGFARAAEQLDPLARTMTLISHEPVLIEAPAAACVVPCHYYSAAEEVS